jgi:ABC-type lipoprotein export system ATPase subunit
VSRGERRKRAIEALTKVGLADQLKKKPNQMSGGQMQRVAIARALVNDPEILLADEPTGALDSETGVMVLRLLLSMARDMGKTIIIVTHNQNIARMADVVVRVKNGQIIACEEQEHPLNVEEVDW